MVLSTALKYDWLKARGNNSNPGPNFLLKT